MFVLLSVMVWTLVVSEAAKIPKDGKPSNEHEDLRPAFAPALVLAAPMFTRISEFFARLFQTQGLTRAVQAVGATVAGTAVVSTALALKPPPPPISVCDLLPPPELSVCEEGDHECSLDNAKTVTEWFANSQLGPLNLPEIPFWPDLKFCSSDDTECQVENVITLLKSLIEQHVDELKSIAFGC